MDIELGGIFGFLYKLWLVIYWMSWVAFFWVKDIIDGEVIQVSFLLRLPLLENQ